MCLLLISLLTRMAVYLSLRGGKGLVQQDRATPGVRLQASHLALPVLGAFVLYFSWLLAEAGPLFLLNGVCVCVLMLPTSAFYTSSNPVPFLLQRNV